MSLCKSESLKECFNCKFIDDSITKFTGKEMHERIHNFKIGKLMCNRCNEYWDNYNSVEE